MAKRDWEIVRNSGDTGKKTVESRTTSAEKAREIADAERRQTLKGSSDWFEVRKRS